MKNQSGAIFWIILFNLIIIFAEVYFGVIGNSFALLSDALHNFGDILALIVTHFALRLALKKSSFKYTFGFIKAEMMATFINSVFLFVIMFYIIFESIGRLAQPVITDPIYMIIVGFIALIANGISAILLHKLKAPHSHHCAHQEDQNIKSAYLHMLSDALISLGVVLGGVFILLFGTYSLDSWLAIVFSVYILWHTYPLLKLSFLSLMDANIDNTLSLEKLDTLLKKDENIISYHDFHISQPSSKHRFISFHLVFKNGDLSFAKIRQIITTIRKSLKQQGFTHVLIQPDLNEDNTKTFGCKL